MHSLISKESGKRKGRRTGFQLPARSFTDAAAERERDALGVLPKKPRGTSVNPPGRPWMLGGCCCFPSKGSREDAARERGRTESRQAMHRLRCLGQSLLRWPASHGSQAASPDTIPRESFGLGSDPIRWPVPVLATAGRPGAQPLARLAGWWTRPLPLASV